MLACLEAYGKEGLEIIHFLWIEGVGWGRTEVELLMGPGTPALLKTGFGTMCRYCA